MFSFSPTTIMSDVATKFKLLSCQMYLQNANYYHVRCIYKIQNNIMSDVSTKFKLLSCLMYLQNSNYYHVWCLYFPLLLSYMMYLQNSHNDNVRCICKRKRYSDTCHHCAVICNHTPILLTHSHLKERTIFLRHSVRLLMLGNDF